MEVQPYNLDSFRNYLDRNKMDTQSHQTEGVEWCLHIEKEGEEMDGRKVKSAILADEMGLGKTIQMIGLILCNFKTHTLLYSLVLCLNNGKEYSVEPLVMHH